MSDEDDNDTVIVIDNGSGSCKAGFSGDASPSVIIPSLVGRHYGSLIGVREFYIGEEALEKKNRLSLNYPMEHGIVSNWDDMIIIWNSVFSKLLVDSAENPVLITEAPLNPKANSEKIFEIMFETFSVPACFVSSTSMATNFMGRTTGIMVELGDGVINIVPFYDECSIPSAITRLDFAGRDLTEYLMTLLMKRKYSFSTTYEREIIRDLKETLCYVAMDYNLEMQKYANDSLLEEKYLLPNGDTITVGNEKFCCPEALFEPSLLGVQSQGLHQAIHSSIQKCDVDMRKDLYANIVLYGGTSMCSGLQERLESELKQLCPYIERLRVVAPPSRKNAVWFGGSILASLSSFKKLLVSKKDYFEYGPSIVHRKSF